MQRYCARCGAGTLPEAAFCVRCGSPVEPGGAILQERGEPNAASGEHAPAATLTTAQRPAGETQEATPDGASPSGETSSVNEDSQTARTGFLASLAAPFVWIEKKVMEPISAWLGDLEFLNVLEYIGKLGILAVVILWLWTIPDRDRQSHYEAWQVITSAEGQGGTGGRIEALEHLYKAEQSLVGLTADNAFLKGIDLCDRWCAVFGSIGLLPDEWAARLDSASLQEADLTEADLREVSLWRARLRGAALRDADLRGSNLTYADLREAYLPNTNLQDALLSTANLGEATLTDARLQGADLGRATDGDNGAALVEADLQNARLQGADLSGANLREANLSGADLSGAMLDGADLFNATIRGADLSEAENLTPEQIGGAYGDGETRLPGYLEAERPSWWSEVSSPLVVGSLPAEDWSLGLFVPALSFSVGDGWQVDYAETKDYLAISRDEYAPEITFHNVKDVYNPEKTTEENIEPAPDDMVAWFENHPNLDVTEEEEVTIGGVSGTQLDTVVSSTPEDYPSDVCSGPCLPIFPISDGGTFFQNEGQQSRLIILEVQGETVVITINTLASNDLQEAQEVLDTVTWNTMLEELPTGEISSEEFEPTLSFTIGEGWQDAGRLPDSLVISQEDSTLSFLNVREVYDPDAPNLTNVAFAPEDAEGMVEWFQNHPYLEAGETEPVEVGGASGVAFDVSIPEAPEDYPSEECGIPCVPLFRMSDGNPFWFYEGYRVRVIIVDVGGEAVTIAIESRADEFDEFLPQAEEVLSTVKWRG